MRGDKEDEESEGDGVLQLKTWTKIEFGKNRHKKKKRKKSSGKYHS